MPADSAAATLAGSLWWRRGQPLPVEPPDGAVVRLVLEDGTRLLAERDDWPVDRTMPFAGPLAGVDRWYLHHLTHTTPLAWHELVDLAHWLIIFVAVPATVHIGHIEEGSNGMRRTRVIDATGGGTARLDRGSGDTVVDLTLTGANKHSSTVLLDHHAAVWLMAALGAFVAAAEPSLADYPAMDRDGHQHAAVVTLTEDFAHRSVLLRVTNNTDLTTAVVRLDRPTAGALMAELGAFVATS